MKSVFVAVFALVMAGCSTVNTNARVYSAGQVFSEGRADSGVVLSVSPVNLQQGPSGYAAVGGAVLGAVVGSQIGGGSGRNAGGAVGAVLGANLANRLEAPSRVVPGYLIVVKNKRGRTSSFIQDQSIAFTPGMRVVIIGQGRDSRVFPG